MQACPSQRSAAMFEMMQEVYDRAATVQYKQGNSEAVLALVTELQKRIKEFQTEPTTSTARRSC
ncbi:MAG: hypothetical protein H6837_13285 [Planctomycetes bacterium]|nr:hypothetical protein [Planctomycetota bacterium]